MANDNNNIQITDESQIVLYQPNESISLQVKIDASHDTVWLTQQQIADLFGTKRPAITKHLRNIFNSGELDPKKAAIAAAIARAKAKKAAAEAAKETE